MLQCIYLLPKGFVLCSMTAGTVAIGVYGKRRHYTIAWQPIWQPLGSQAGTNGALPAHHLPQNARQGCAFASQIGSYYRVRFSTDPDEPAALVPSCCVWTENGLCTTPASAANGSAEVALCQLAGT